MTTVEIKNTNFICTYMNVADLRGAFGLPNNKTIHNYLYTTLIPDGWIKKHNERFWKPTEKLLNLAFLPEKVVFTDEQMRYLSYNLTFSRADLINIVDDNEQIVKRMIKLGLILMEKGGTYRKSVAFEEHLAEGEQTINLLNEGE